MADEALVTRAIAEIGLRARGDTAALPHPCEIDDKLRDRLETATAAASLEVAGRLRPLLDRVLGPMLGQQSRYNEALVDAIHQLDHRTRQQDQRITDLEAEVAALRAARP